VRLETYAANSIVGQKGGMEKAENQARTRFWVEYNEDTQKIPAQKRK